MTACLKELAADPVGRACGDAVLPPPPPPPPPLPAPCGAVTPCSSRHLVKEEDVFDELELELELEPLPAELPPLQPATATTEASATAPKIAGRMARRPCLLPGRSKRLIKRFPP